MILLVCMPVQSDYCCSIAEMICSCGCLPNRSFEQVTRSFHIGAVCRVVYWTRVSSGPLALTATTLSCQFKPSKGLQLVSRWRWMAVLSSVWCLYLGCAHLNCFAPRKSWHETQDRTSLHSRWIPMRTRGPFENCIGRLLHSIDTWIFCNCYRFCILITFNDSLALKSMARR